MNSTDFEHLKRSVTEGEAIINGRRKPSREFKVRLAANPPSKNGYALCVKSDDPTVLIPSKIYQAVFSSNCLVGVTDEEGEASVYPSEHFVRLEFPAEVETLLGEIQKAA